MNATKDPWIVHEDEACVNVTWAGQKGDLADPVSRDVMATEVRPYELIQIHLKTPFGAPAR